MAQTKKTTTTRSTSRKNTPAAEPAHATPNDMSDGANDVEDPQPPAVDHAPTADDTSVAPAAPTDTVTPQNATYDPSAPPSSAPDQEDTETHAPATREQGVDLAPSGPATPTVTPALPHNGNAAATASPAAADDPTSIGDVAPTAAQDGCVSTAPAQASVPDDDNTGFQPVLSNAARRKEKQKAAKEAALRNPPTAPPTQSELDEQEAAEMARDPDLAANLVYAKAQSARVVMGDANTRASSSHHPPPEPAADSAPKRQRANTQGDAVHIRARSWSPEPGDPNYVPRAPYFTDNGLRPTVAFTIPPPTFEWKRQHVHPHVTLAKYPKDLLEEIQKTDTTKLIINICGGFRDTTQARKDIAEALDGMLNKAKGSFRVATIPISDDGSVAQYAVVLDLHPAQIDFLLDAQGASLSSGPLSGKALFFSNFESHGSDYVVTIAGLGFERPQAEDALAFFKARILSNDAVLNFILTHREALSTEYDAGDIIYTLGNRFDARYTPVYGNSGDNTRAEFHGWNIYIPSPSTTYDNYLGLRQLVERINFRSMADGQGWVVKPFRCSICASADHPAALCPFPSITGWVGPTATTIRGIAEDNRNAASRATAVIATKPNSSGNRRNNNQASGSNARDNRPAGGRNNNSNGYQGKKSNKKDNRRDRQGGRDKKGKGRDFGDDMDEYGFA